MRNPVFADSGCECERSLSMREALNLSRLGAVNLDLDHSDPELTDVTVHSARTWMRGVKAANVEGRPWIANFPVCPALNQHQMVHVGIMEAAAPTQIVRAKQSTTYFLACFGGKGNVLIDGRWRVCRAGYACLLPAHTLNAFHALPGVRWKFCWACYQQPSSQRPLADVASPVMARFDALPLHSAILGLMHECHNGTEPIVTQHWVDLIQSYVLRFAQSMETTDPLRLLWERVAMQLAEHWTLARLIRESGYSREHLRRLCQRQLGRGPMHQVIYLRMHRATELLATTSKTLDAIAREVGYQNPFVFSNAFTRWIGWRPSEYRRKRMKSPATRASGAERHLLGIHEFTNLIQPQFRVEAV
jgi:AraC-like DNA-binding protein